MQLGTEERVGGPQGMRLVHHEHVCAGCKTPFRCHAPECVGVEVSCAKCKLVRIEAGIAARRIG